MMDAIQSSDFKIVHQTLQQNLVDPNHFYKVNICTVSPMLFTNYYWQASDYWWARHYQRCTNSRHMYVCVYIWTHVKH